MHIFSILISVLTLSSFIFVTRTKSKALRQYKKKKLKKKNKQIPHATAATVFQSF